VERGTGARIMTVMTDGTTPAVGPRLCRYKKKTNSSAIAERPQSALVSAKSGRLGLCSTTLTMTESACKAIEFGEKKTQNKGGYTIQRNSRSTKSKPIESPYATSYY